MLKSGELYDCTAPRLVKQQQMLMETIYEFNQTRPLE